MMALVDHPVPKRENEPKATHAWATGVVLVGLLVNALWLIALLAGLLKIVAWLMGLL